MRNKLQKKKTPAAERGQNRVWLAAEREKREEAVGRMGFGGGSKAPKLFESGKDSRTEFKVFTCLSSCACFPALQPMAQAT
jgi:hypothetical protein